MRRRARIRSAAGLLQCTLPCILLCILLCLILLCGMYSFH